MNLRKFFSRMQTFPFSKKLVLTWNVFWNWSNSIGLPQVSTKSLIFLMPLSYHDFFKLILRFGLNHSGVSWMISLCVVISVLKRESTLFNEIGPKRVVDNIFDSVHFVWAN